MAASSKIGTFTPPKEAASSPSADRRLNVCVPEFEVVDACVQPVDASLRDLQVGRDGFAHAFSIGERPAANLQCLQHDIVLAIQPQTFRQCVVGTTGHRGNRKTLRGTGASSSAPR